MAETKKFGDESGQFDRRIPKGRVEAGKGVVERSVREGLGWTDPEFPVRKATGETLGKVRGLLSSSLEVDEKSADDRRTNSELVAILESIGKLDQPRRNLIAVLDGACKFLSKGMSRSEAGIIQELDLGLDGERLFLRLIHVKTVPGLDNGQILAQHLAYLLRYSSSGINSSPSKFKLQADVFKRFLSGAV